MRLPLLLYTYLAAEILAPLFASFIILTCILFLGKVIPLLRILLDYGVIFPDFVRICAYLAPQFFLFSIPMAGMIGVVLGFTRLTNNQEIMAFKACGVGLYRMLPPVMIIALSLALITGLFSTRLIPAGNIAMEKMLLQLAKEKIDKGLQEKRFSQSISGLVLYADRINPDSGEWQGVYVSDKRDPQIPSTIMARKGSLQTRIEDMSLTLSLHNGSIHRVSGEISQDINFKNYVLDLALHSPREDISGWGGNKSLTQSQLLAMAKKSGPDTEQGAKLLIEYHQRLVLPVSCFFLALLGLPLGFMAAPGRRALGVPLGIGLFVLYYVMISAAKAAGESLTVPVAPAMWAPNLIFAVITLYLIQATAKETVSPRLERILTLGHGITDRLIRSILLKTGRAATIANQPLCSDSATGIYHRPGCPHYDLDRHPITFTSDQEATAAGFTPCEICAEPEEGEKS